MSFLRITRHGARVKSSCEYIGPVSGGVPWGVQSRPRKPRDFGEERTPRVDVRDPQDRAAVQRQIEQGIAVAAERLAREKRRRAGDYGKQERRLKRLQWEIKALRTLGEEVGLWRRL